MDCWMKGWIDLVMDSERLAIGTGCRLKPGLHAI
jgi:hypothetical protein